MELQTDSDINGESAKALRAAAKMSQEAFWGSVGVSQPAGSQYEGGDQRIPKAVRALVFMRYVAGIKHDSSTIDGAKSLQELAARENSPQGNN